LLSRFSTQSTFKIVRRTRESDNITPWNPFQSGIADSSLVSTSSNIRNTFYFNRADPKFDFQIGMFETQNRVVLVTGFESRSNDEQFFRTRWNLSRSFSTQLYLAQGLRTNDSEFFDNRDYLIDFYKIEPQLTWFPNKSFRTVLKYKFLDSRNILIKDGETTSNNDFSLELSFNKRNTPVEFALLEGLKNGQNYLWSVVLERRLAKNIQLSISYEGRKTGILNTVHVGRAQVRATF